MDKITTKHEEVRAVELKAHGELTIEQVTEGPAELSVEGPPEVVSRVTAQVEDGRLKIGINGDVLDRMRHVFSVGLTSKKALFTLSLPTMDELVVSDAAKVFASRLELERLNLKVSGAGSVTVRWLEAEDLDVYLPGASTVNISGKVERQSLIMDGIASYNAPRLTSTASRIELKGAGKAVVCAKEELDVIVRGLGSVHYYGDPTLHRDVTGLGSIKRVGDML